MTSLRALAEDDGDGFDPKVFWPVNAFIFLLIIGACIWCWWCGGKAYFFYGGSNPESRQRSDLAYQQTVLARQQRREERRRDTPEKRKKRLIECFRRCQVSMVRVKYSLSNQVSAGADPVAVHLCVRD